MNDEYPKPKRGWLAKFSDAFRGAAIGIRGHSSFAVHLVFVVLVIAAAIIFRVGLLQWCLLLLCMTVVLAAEMFNSALETLAKAIVQQHDPHLADGLDIASGAVLIASLGAAFVGIIIFLNRALAMFLGS